MRSADARGSAQERGEAALQPLSRTIKGKGGHVGSCMPARRCRALFSAAPRCCHKCYGKLDCAVDRRPGAVGFWPPRRSEGPAAGRPTRKRRGTVARPEPWARLPHGCVARPGPPQAAGAGGLGQGTLWCRRLRAWFTIRISGA